MLGEYVGLLLVLALGAALLVALLWAHVRAVRRGGPERAPLPDPWHARARAVPSRREAPHACQVAMLCVVWGTLALFLLPSSALIRELGWHGFAALAIAALPLGVGLLYAWAKGVLEW